MASISKFFRRKDVKLFYQKVWIILFYDSDSKNIKDDIEIWKNLASKYYGIFHVAAIDCTEEEVILKFLFLIILGYVLR